MPGYTLVVRTYCESPEWYGGRRGLADRITDPIDVPASLWQRPDTIEALRSRDMRRLFHLLRQYAGASQTRLGIMCGLTQGKVSAIMGGSHRVTALEVFDRIADGLSMPSEARLALGLAPRSSRTGYPFSGWSRAATRLACDRRAYRGVLLARMRRRTLCDGVPSHGWRGRAFSVPSSPTRPRTDRLAWPKRWPPS